MMISTDKQRYITWASALDDLPVFFRPWYLDKVCINGAWNAILSMSDSGEIEGALVYYTTKRYGRKVIIMPMMTPYLGIWIPPSKSEKTTYKIRNLNRVVKKLSQSIPKDVVLYRQSFLPAFNNWLPFYWQRFVQTTRYTFVIPDLKKWSIEDATSNVRNMINKASGILTITDDVDPEKVYLLYDEILSQKGINLAWTLDDFMLWDAALLENNKRLIVGAVDAEGNIHATAYLIIDKDTVYFMISASDKNLRKSGAVPYVMYHSILKASRFTDRFDFEGGMLESMFDVFSGFGGDLTPYYSIHKTKNLLWELVYNFKMKRNILNT